MTTQSEAAQTVNFRLKSNMAVNTGKMWRGIKELKGHLSTSNINPADSNDTETQAKADALINA